MAGLKGCDFSVFQLTTDGLSGLSNAVIVAKNNAGI
jgi:hypothetical protein